METWADLAAGNWAAVVELRGSDEEPKDDQYLRSAVSRAYYAAYAAITEQLVGVGTAFGKGWSNPPHGDVPDLVSSQLAGLYSPWQLATIKAALRRLQKARLDADYRPHRAIDQRAALSAQRDAQAVIRELERHR